MNDSDNFGYRVVTLQALRARRIIVPAEVGKPAYALELKPNAAELLSEREASACRAAIDNGSLVECQISTADLIPLLHSMLRGQTR